MGPDDVDLIFWKSHVDIFPDIVFVIFMIYYVFLFWFHTATGFKPNRFCFFLAIHSLFLVNNFPYLYPLSLLIINLKTFLEKYPINILFKINNFFYPYLYPLSLINS